MQRLLQSIPHWKFNWIEVLTIYWPVFWVDKFRYMKVQVGNCMRDVNVALIAITPFEKPPRLQRIFNQWATIKLLNFIASCSPQKCYNLIYVNLRYVISYLTKVVYSSWLSEVRSVKLLSWDQSQDTIIKESDIPFSLKILTVMIKAYDGRAECCLNLNI